MDIATLIGIAGASGLIIWAMAGGGSLGAFVDVPSLIIVVGGTIAVVLGRHTLPEFIGHLGGAAKAFMPKLQKLEPLVEMFPELGTLARREGMLEVLGRKARRSESRTIMEGESVGIFQQAYYFSNKSPSVTGGGITSQRRPETEMRRGWGIRVLFVSGSRITPYYEPATAPHSKM